MSFQSLHITLFPPQWDGKWEHWPVGSLSLCYLEKRGQFECGMESEDAYFFMVEVLIRVFNRELKNSWYSSKGNAMINIKRLASPQSYLVFSQSSSLSMGRCRFENPKTHGMDLKGWLVRSSIWTCSLERESAFLKTVYPGTHLHYYHMYCWLQI